MKRWSGSCLTWPGMHEKSPKCVFSGMVSDVTDWLPLDRLPRPACPPNGRYRAPAAQSRTVALCTCLRVLSVPSYNAPPGGVPMPFTYRRVSMDCAVTANAGPAIPA